MENPSEDFAATKNAAIMKRRIMKHGSSSRFRDSKQGMNINQSKEVVPISSTLKNASNSRDRAEPHDVDEADRFKVKWTLQQFEEMYRRLTRKNMLQGDVVRAARIDLEVAKYLDDNNLSINKEKQIGHIPGIVVGDRFRFRAQLAVIGLHSPYVSGIDYMLYRGKKHAISIVNSGRYENTTLANDVLIFCGQGGCEDFGERTDQKMERGNLALMYSMKNEIPVRVIQKSGSVYIYDGLYKVVNCKEVSDRTGNSLFKYELHRFKGELKLSYGRRKSLSARKECRLVRDISEGKEKMPVSVVNGVDEDKPRGFTYIASTQFPDWCKETRSYRGCNCTNGCSNSVQCLCVSKNGGYIPYSEKGEILGPKPVIYECGPHCKCSLSCKNRVSQRGLRYKLEIYKTESGEWGVRSKSFISSGCFICEYSGVFVLRKNDDYDEMGFTIDASQKGNVARFLRSGKAPNAFVQRVLYDHDDERMPRLMIFAAKNIPPLMEITCDYDDSDPSLRFLCL